MKTQTTTSILISRVWNQNEWILWCNLANKLLQKRRWFTKELKKSEDEYSSFKYDKMVRSIIKCNNRSCFFLHPFHFDFMRLTFDSIKESHTNIWVNSNLNNSDENQFHSLKMRANSVKVSMSPLLALFCQISRLFRSIKLAQTVWSWNSKTLVMIDSQLSQLDESCSFLIKQNFVCSISIYNFWEIQFEIF